MSSLEKLKNIASIQDFAELLYSKKAESGKKVRNLAYILYHFPSNEKYTEFEIPKKSGSKRTIKAPFPPLKILQRKLANILNECVEEIEKNRNSKTKPLSHGFKKKIKIEKNRDQVLGINTNARCHKNKRYVLNLDLKNFFPSFNFGRVRGFFIKNRNFELSEKAATLIAHLVCYQNELPQGSPCSPVITNLIAHILDVRLVQLAKKYGCTYSRYADDITFSTNRKTWPEEIARPYNNSSKCIIGDELEEIIQNAGFSINPDKTRLQYRSSRQMVTGLVVNRKVNVKAEYYRYARAMCHSLFKKGEFFFPKNCIQRAEDNHQKAIRKLEGMLSHIDHIKKSNRTDEECKRDEEAREAARKNKKRLKPDGTTELYSKLLHFCYFVALDKPLVMCEGKTDNIYLKTAIKQLKKGEFQFDHDLDFFPFSERVRRVMQIFDGADARKNFIKHYEKNLHFTKLNSEHPVIVLLDNEEKLADGIIKMLKGQGKKEEEKYNRKSKFCYAWKNLYVVFVPMQKNKTETVIEDLFDEELKKKELNGKTFCSENGKGFNKDKHYSKTVFAKEIVQPNQDKINFNRFQPFLTQISSAIEDWSKRKSKK